MQRISEQEQEQQLNKVEQATQTTLTGKAISRLEENNTILKECVKELEKTIEENKDYICGYALLSLW